MLFVCASFLFLCWVFSSFLYLLLIDHVGREHFRELVVLEATSQEFLFGQVAVAVLVHAGEDILGSFLGLIILSVSEGND